MRRLVPVLALALAAPIASAQAVDSTATADSAAVDASRTTTLVLPNGDGVFYYRAGPPGGVRIRSRRARPAAPATAAPPEAPDVTGTTRATSEAPGGVSRLDLALLEDRLLRAIDQRLAGLDAGYRPPARTPAAPGAAPVIVLPAAPTPAAPTPTVPVPVPTPIPPAPSPVAPAAPAADPDPLVEEVERAILDTGLFRTTRVNFEFGEAALLPVSEASLRAVSSVLLRYLDLRIEVGGHTDWISSDAYNLRLSQRRAESVRDFLIGSGVAADRIDAVGYGESRPIASNETETGRALNRRVEFVALNPEAAERDVRSASPSESDDLRQLIRDELERLQSEDDGGR